MQSTSRHAPIAAIMKRCGIDEDAAACIGDGVAADAASVLSAIEDLAAAVPCAAGTGMRNRIGLMAKRCLRVAGDGIAAQIAPAGITTIGRAAPMAGIQA